MITQHSNIASPSLGADLKVAGPFLAGAFLVAVLGLPTGASAQTGTWSQQPLPGGEVFQVAEADSGRLLVANLFGAFELDGRRAHRLPIHSPGPDSLAGRCVLRASNGAIWLGTTRYGLFRLGADGEVSRFTAASGVGNFSNDEILSLAETQDGSIWAGTSQGGLSRFDGTTWSTLTTDDGLPSSTVAALAADPRDGSLWAGMLGAPGGLVHVVGGVVASVRADFTLTSSDNVRAIKVTEHGDVWLGHDAGLARFDGANFDEYSAGTAVVAIAPGKHGEVWFGTPSRGVGRWDTGSLRLLPSGPPSNTIRSTLIDAAGVLWVGTSASLARFEGAAWLSYTRSDGLPFPALVYSGLRDASSEARGDSLDERGVEWIGMSAVPFSPEQKLKLARRANGRMQQLGSLEGVLPGAVSALASADSGGVWVATARADSGGVTRLRVDGSVARTLSLSAGIPSGFVLALAQAGPGEVWVGTAGGAAVIDASGVSRLPTSDSAIPDASVVGVAVDEAGRVWFATGENPFGLDARQPRGAIRFDPSDSSYLGLGLAEGLPTENLNSVSVAPNGDVWFGSNIGAIRWRSGVVRLFSINDGLPNSVVSHIASDPAGQVWAATDDGLAIFDGAQWSTYNVGDGLVGARAIHVFVDSLGAIVSCKEDGVSLFHPDHTPPLVEVATGPPATAGYRLIQFGVRGGDLDSDDARLLYSTQLDGRAATPFEMDVTTVSYNLLDGDYVFRVRAKDRALNETAEAAEWRFTVDATPPRPLVQQPVFNAIVADTVHVLGTVADPRLAEYIVELRAAGTTRWDTLFTSPTPPAPGAPLYDWPSRNVNDGVWELRVGAIDSLGLIGYAQVSVIVDNFAPSASVTAPALVDHVTGGHVFTTNGEVELYVPPNAFAADQIVRIDPLPTAGPAAGALVVWALRADEPALAKPATLTLRIPGPVFAPAGARLATSPEGPAPTIARLVVADGDTTLVPIGGALSADGSRLTTTISTLGIYAIVVDLIPGEGFEGARALDCQPRVFSPRGGGFDARTAISFELGRSGSGAIKVYDRAGRLVREVSESGAFTAGTNVVYWDGTDGDGEVVPSGLYTVAARFDGKTAVRTVVVANR